MAAPHVAGLLLLGPVTIDGFVPFIVVSDSAATILPAVSITQEYKSVPSLLVIIPKLSLVKISTTAGVL